MHSVNFSFNLKLSIQKHKYSLPHFPSNQTNTKVDTDMERERETQAQILSNLQKPNETKTEQIFHRDCKIHRARCNPCFSKSFSRETNRLQGERESSYSMDERGEIGLDEQKAIERSIFFFFFHFLTPILFFLWKSKILLHIQGFQECSTIIS